MNDATKDTDKNITFYKVIKKSYKYIIVLLIVAFLVQRGTSVLEAKRVQQESLAQNIDYIDIAENKNTILVNRENEIDENYVPDNLVELNVRFINDNANNKLLEEEAAIHIERMFEDAKKVGVELLAVSGYRSYEYQKELYEKKVDKMGKYEADRYVAQPGTSEHQTGLAIDILSTEYKRLDEGFKNTYAYSWLCENIEEYGFIIRYQKGKEEITGYEYEPWHLRYVGKELAKELKYKGITLEEYYIINQRELAIR